MRVISLLGACALSVLGVGTANAAVTVYTSQAAYTAATTTTNLADFEGLTFGPRSVPITQGGIIFSKLAIDLYVAAAGTLTNTTQTTSASLTADGDENFDIRLASAATFGAIGFDVISNAYGPRTVSLFTIGGSLIGTFTSPQSPNTVGFFGLISTTSIGYVQTFVDRGYIQDTAIDNVRIGPVVAVSAVPEPSSWIILMSGFGLVGGAMRYRRRRTRTSFG
jgi:PEP-CTERM motif